MGQEIGNQKDNEEDEVVKGGGDSDLYNYSSSNENNEDELFESVKRKYKGKRKR